MTILKTTKELIAFRNSLSGSVGFVPTMGALHDGHLSLIKKSVQENETTIVSIFINPTQFGENEDLDKYPKKEEADLKICSLARVDAVFLPDVSQIYFENEPLIIASNLADKFEGEHRKGHFNGVLRVVLKLLNLTRATNAYFGKKDAQQYFIVKNMVDTLFINTCLNPCEIVRDKDGLALSSRNVYLSDDDRIKALKISKSLRTATKLIIKGELNSNLIKDEIMKELSGLEVDYVAIVDREFNEIKSIQISQSIILIAAKVGTTRLIDNIWV